MSLAWNIAWTFASVGAMLFLFGAVKRMRARDAEQAIEQRARMLEISTERSAQLQSDAAKSVETAQRIMYGGVGTVGLAVVLASLNVLFGH